MVFWASSRITKESLDRKSTRLNSSHSQISYAVFCLKKKKIIPHYCGLSTQHLFLLFILIPRLYPRVYPYRITNPHQYPSAQLLSTASILHSELTRL